MNTTYRRLTVTETAQIIRTTLKRKYPETKFSVRSKSYSGGASIDVSWTDGPRGKEVDEILNGFEGKSFDGMNDLASHQDSWLLPDGTAELAYRPDSYGGSIPEYISNSPNPNAELVSFGADYIFSNRDISNWEQKHVEAAQYIRSHCHCEGIPPNDRFGNDWVNTLANRLVYDQDMKETLEQAFERII
jgi:hypothetical protein